MFEENLQKSIFSSTGERTFIDKLLAKGDVDEIKKLIRKRKLSREELLELLYMISSTESKLLNLDEWSRYILLKYFVWIREFIQIAELFYDQKDALKKKEEFKFTPRSKQLIENVENRIEHIAKFLIDLYFNIARTTLSLGATAFIEMLKNKYEIAYPNMPQAQQAQPNKIVWGGKGKNEG